MVALKAVAHQNVQCQCAAALLSGSHSVDPTLSVIHSRACLDNVGCWVTSIQVHPSYTICNYWHAFHAHGHKEPSLDSCCSAAHTNANTNCCSTHTHTHTFCLVTKTNHNCLNDLGVSLANLLTEPFYKLRMIPAPEASVLECWHARILPDDCLYCQATLQPRMASTRGRCA